MICVLDGHGNDGHWPAMRMTVTWVLQKSVTTIETLGSTIWCSTSFVIFFGDDGNFINLFSSHDSSEIYVYHGTHGLPKKHQFDIFFLVVKRSQKQKSELTQPREKNTCLACKPWVITMDYTFW